MKRNLPFYLEMMWLLVAISSLLFAVYRSSNVGFNESIMLYVIAALASLMYGSRRYLRKTQEKRNQDKN